MAYFITDILIKEILHLKDFRIEIDKDERKHLIITGKNGTGKTILINAIASFLNRVPNVQDQLDVDSQNGLPYQDISHQVSISFNSTHGLANACTTGNFVLAFYEAQRKPQLQESKTPQKPNLFVNEGIDKKKVSQFLNFLVDLKIQEALARNEQQPIDADKIADWFNSFEQLLQQIFSDNELKLQFNYRDYSFLIVSEGKQFKFTQLSDGYSAIIDIVADLILRMQDPNSPVRTYEKEGVVLIDEIETHLHLELQRLILPMLTTVFPNIQFIVTTHSPFILNSLDNSVAFDLETRKRLEDLTEYSYEALAEGYFGARTESSYVELRLNRLKELLESTGLNDSEKVELDELMNDFNQIVETVSPQVKADYLQLKLKYAG